MDDLLMHRVNGEDGIIVEGTLLQRILLYLILMLLYRTSQSVELANIGHIDQYYYLFGVFGVFVKLAIVALSVLVIF